MCDKLNLGTFYARKLNKNVCCRHSLEAQSVNVGLKEIFQAN